MASNASSGHKLGQIIGDWFEEYVALPILYSVANDLNLFLDSRFIRRTCRGEKITWADQDGNIVDYDFVMELAGSDTKKGIPIGFFETFWRRGSRHSKDKARDDSGKLVPMRQTYPTSRFLGILSAGDFTRPAQELVTSRSIDLFYIPKNLIISSWEKNGLTIDYPDDLPEEKKSALVASVSSRIEDTEFLTNIAKDLADLVGDQVLQNYKSRLKYSISAPPMIYEITPIFIGEKRKFSKHDEIDDFLNSLKNISAEENKFKEMVSYNVVFGDGTIFVREKISTEEALELHKSVGEVQTHFATLI